MTLSKVSSLVLALIIAMSFFFSCKTEIYDNISGFGREPVIDPDYSGVIIPPNIAPLNFRILENSKCFKIRVSSPFGEHLFIKSTNGIVNFPLRTWKKLLAESVGGKIKIEVLSEDIKNIVRKYYPFYIRVSCDSIDPFLCYRLLYPGYESWSEMKIVQRSMETFKEYSLVENQLLEDNCVNCHSFKQNNPDMFLIHVRGSLAGTYFVNGKKVTRTGLRTQNMLANAVYPSWHPSGRYVVFSSNRIMQAIHMRPEKNIETYDVFASLVIYDIEKNEISACGENDSEKYMETFPCWSPGGDYLYYCSAAKDTMRFDYRQVKYNLVRKYYNQVSGSFGKAEVVFDALAIDKSVSFPAISPDGQYLVFTLHDYGTFSIWHKEADLYLLNLKNRKVDRLNLNSNETESYHSWSSNGKWLVFSSKRGDGLTARPFIAYFGSSDSIGKPFILPQKDPTLYKRMQETFNRPEFVTGKVIVGPRDFARASKKEPVNAVWKKEKP